MNLENNSNAIFGFIIDEEAPDSIRILSGGSAVIMWGNSGRLLIEFRCLGSVDILLKIFMIGSFRIFAINFFLINCRLNLIVYWFFFLLLLLVVQLFAIKFGGPVLLKK